MLLFGDFMCDVKLFVYSRLGHNRMILTGFRELERQKKIKLTIVQKYNKVDECLLGQDIVEGLINNKTKIAFDMHDGYGYSLDDMDSYIKTVDFYFKRSFSSQQNKKLSAESQSKIYPLSFNWDVGYFTNPMEWEGGLSNIKTLIKKFIYRNDIKYYEKPEKKTSNKIMFMCRLWSTDEEDLPQYLIEERKEINNTRIQIIKNLKDIYGDDFIGGLEDSKFTRENCPELILPSYLTKKPNYIKAMKQSSICIASTGLHKSIGWKFAEYVASGKAIVTEKLNYEVIGDFKPNKNYLEYSTVDECLLAVEKLYNNSELIKEIENNNRHYYFEYARPDKQMEYVVNTIIRA